MQSRRALNEHERRVIAFHEAGHALCAELLPGVDRDAQGLDRPARQGARLHAALPRRRTATSRRATELIDQMTVLLGGRAAEQLVFGAITTGASDDLKQVAEISRRMIHEWAMGTSVSALQLAAEGGAVSDRTRELRDAEQQHLADEAMRRAVALITEHRAQLDAARRARCCATKSSNARTSSGSWPASRRPGGSPPATCGSPRRPNKRPEGFLSGSDEVVCGRSPEGWAPQTTSGCCWSPARSAPCSSRSSGSLTSGRSATRAWRASPRRPAWSRCRRT